MKKLFRLIIILALLLIGCQAAVLMGCQTAVERDKKAMLELYCNDENYITLTGQVVEIDNQEHNITVVIKCDDIKDFVADVNEEYKYWVFSNSYVDIGVGELIEYTTVKTRFKNNDWLPIVAITKNNENILEVQEGKENLIQWVNQLQYK